jgi:hypothetical protein
MNFKSRSKTNDNSAERSATSDSNSAGGMEVTPIDTDQFAIITLQKNEISDILAENLGGTGLSIQDLETIKVPSGAGGQWEVPGVEGVKHQKALEGIVIFSQSTRAYWPDSFNDTGGGTPPQCMSVDAITGIGDPGGECSGCPKAEFGSDPHGSKRGQACAESRLAFMVMKEDILPMVIKIPAMSLGNSRKYLTGLLSKRRAIHSVYTRLTLEKDKNKDGIDFSKIIFEKYGDVENPEASKAYSEVTRTRTSPE